MDYVSLTTFHIMNNAGIYSLKKEKYICFKFCAVSSISALFVIRGCPFLLERPL